MSHPSNCPHCGLQQHMSGGGNVVWYFCGSRTDGARSGKCIHREPLFRELQAAKARIEALETVMVIEIEERDVSIEQLERELSEANAYARKLNLKLTDLCAERDAAKARNQRLMDAGGRLFEELDDKTPEPNCRCHVFPPCSDCTNHASSREALAEWKEAITESTQKAVVRSVEEINGGMGPDYAEIYLATGHVIQVNDEGLLLGPSVAAYESGENCQILGSIAFDSKEANK